MSQLTTVQENYKTVAGVLQSPAMLKQLQLACTKSVTAERLARVALTLMKQNDKLAECSWSSIAGALMQCAQLGLEPGPLGLAYIIPYRKEAQFQIGYRGLLALIWRSELVSSVQSEVVREKDYFDYSYGTPPHLKHIPAPGNRGAVTHVYCVIGVKSGGWIPRVMTFDEIEAHRKQYSQTSRSDAPWVTAWDEQACKTVIKRTAKRAPVSSETQAAIGLDDQADVGIAQKLDAAIEVTDVTDTPADEPEGGGEG